MADCLVARLHRGCTLAPFIAAGARAGAHLLSRANPNPNPYPNPNPKPNPNPSPSPNPNPNPNPNQEPICSLACCAQHGALYGGGTGGTIHSWSTDSWAPLLKLDGHTDEVRRRKGSRPSAAARHPRL